MFLVCIVIHLLTFYQENLYTPLQVGKKNNVITIELYALQQTVSISLNPRNVHQSIYIRGSVHPLRFQSTKGKDSTALALTLTRSRRRFCSCLRSLTGSSSISALPTIKPRLRLLPSTSSSARWSRSACSAGRRRRRRSRRVPVS